jgi:hypothetical protein
VTPEYAPANEPNSRANTSDIVNQSGSSISGLAVLDALSTNETGRGMSSLPIVDSRRPSQFTFLLNDAGETKALTPVMQKLDSAGVNYSILADSTAKTLLHGNPHLVPLPQDVAALSRSDPQAAIRANASLDAATSAPHIITGLVSDFQKSWSDFFRGMGKTVTGYYDGFGYSTLPNKTDAFAGSLNALITPSYDTANFFKQKFSHIPVVAMGQPTLEKIPERLQRTNLPALGAGLGIDPRKPTLLFAGGYGKDYAQAFNVFCQTVKAVPQANVLVSPHPKTDGTLETELLRRHGLENRVRIVPKTIDTAQVLGLSDIVLSQNSTMSVQASLQGKKVLLVGNSGNIADNYEFNPVTAYGITSRYKTPFELTPALQGLLGTNQTQSAHIAEKERLQGLQRLLSGIPPLATDTITRSLLSLPQTQTPGYQAI